MSTLSLPNQYKELEQEEMEYLEGGWSGGTFAQNLKDLWYRAGTSQAFAGAGISWGMISAAASYSYYGACAVFGEDLVFLGFALGGAVGALIAGMGAGAAIYYLGNHIVF